MEGTEFTTAGGVVGNTLVAGLGGLFTSWLTTRQRELDQESYLGCNPWGEPSVTHFLQEGPTSLRLCNLPKQHHLSVANCSNT